MKTLFSPKATFPNLNHAALAPTTKTLCAPTTPPSLRTAPALTKRRCGRRQREPAAARATGSSAAAPRQGRGRRLPRAGASVPPARRGSARGSVMRSDVGGRKGRRGAARRGGGDGDGGGGDGAAAVAMAHRYLLLAPGSCRRRGLPGVLLRQLLCGRGLPGARPCLAQVRGRARARPAASPPGGHGGAGGRVAVVVARRGAAPPLPAARCPGAEGLSVLPAAFPGSPSPASAKVPARCLPFGPARSEGVSAAPPGATVAAGVRAGAPPGAAGSFGCRSGPGSALLGGGGGT